MLRNPSSTLRPARRGVTDNVICSMLLECIKK